MEETNFNYSIVFDGMKENTMFSINSEDIGKGSTTPSLIAIGGVEEIELKKIDPVTIEKYLWMHPVVPRGIEIKANRMIRRGYLISGSNEEANKYCSDIIKNSGGPIRIKKWIEDGYGFGNGYQTFVLNMAGNKVLKLNQEHPIFFSPSKYPYNYKDKSLAGKYIIDSKTRMPVSYTQVNYDKQRKEYNAFGQAIPANRVAHLMFDTWGDEPLGISYVQYLQNEIKYLMNIEEAGAETMYRNGFIQKKINTKVRSEKDLKKLAKDVVNINYKDAIICPEGMDVTNLLPGTTQFPDYHQVFLKLVSCRLGIPLPLLTNDGTETNKACYSEDTQVLTDNGFKFYWEVTGEDKLMQYNPDDNSFEFVNHDGKTYVYEHNLENMLHFSTKNIDVFVTPNHRMYAKVYHKGDYKIIKAEDMKDFQYSFKTTANWKGKGVDYKILHSYINEKGYKLYNELSIEMNDWLEFLGYMISEGGFYQRNGKNKCGLFTIAQKIGNHDDKIANFLSYFNSKYGIHASYYVDKKLNAHRWTYCNMQFWTELSKQGFGAINKLIGKEYLALPKEQLLVLFEALMVGDGCKAGKSYYTTSKKLRDDFIELCLKIGKSISTSEYHDKRILKSGGVRNTNYRIVLSDVEKHSVHRLQIHKIKYKGDKVFCFKVPSGIFVTMRNGKIGIHGNTLDQMIKDMHDDMAADEKIVEQTITQQIFEPACKIVFGDDFTEVPEFKFKEAKEDKESRSVRLLNNSLFFSNVTTSIEKLINIGKEGEANQLLQYLVDNIPNGKNGE